MFPTLKEQGVSLETDTSVPMMKSPMTRKIASRVFAYRTSAMMTFLSDSVSWSMNNMAAPLP